MPHPHLPSAQTGDLPSAQDGAVPPSCPQEHAMDMDHQAGPIVYPTASGHGVMVSWQAQTMLNSAYYS